MKFLDVNTFELFQFEIIFKYLHIISKNSIFIPKQICLGSKIVTFLFKDIFHTTQLTDIENIVPV